MGGGLMQLVAYGAQDVYLTGNPQITFFKVVYRRHTNFSMECIEQPLDSARFGGRHTVQVLRNGDLAGRMYLKTTLPVLPAGVAWCRRPGHAILNYIECTVGGSQVDKHWGQWYDLWYELTHTVDQERGYNKMVGDVTELTTVTASETSAYTVYVPLQFWFNRNTGLALPLIALQYHEVRFNIEFNPLAECVVTRGTATVSGRDLASTSILVDYIYLDQEERRRMAQVGHEYLIEQVQHNGEESVTGTQQKFKLDFNHPCKELIWAVRVGALSSTSDKFLTYYNGNEDLTLAYAARNVAWGMVSNSSGTLTSADWKEVKDFSGPSAEQIVSGTVGLLNVVQGTTTFTFVVTNESSSDFSGNDLWVNTKALPGISENVTSITVNVTVTSANAVKDIAFTDVTVDSHTLTLANVSVPVQTTGDVRSSKSYDMSIAQPFNYGLDLAGNGNPIVSAKLQLNGHDRFDEQDGDYFNYVQPYQHHTRTPADGVNVYSFGLHPEQHQPSGTANLSRIDTTQLHLTFVSNVNGVRGSLLWIFAFSYNVFRIMSGMGGLAYAN